MADLAPDEVLQKYEQKLGPDFGKAFCHARNEWCFIWIIWKQFRNLFCSNQERVDLMNRSGGAFFYSVDRLFFEAVLLALCRLSDPPQTMGKPNLTVNIFQNFMITGEQKEKLKQLLSAVKDTTDFARDWRNRHIGHNDYALMCEAAKPLPSVDIVQIQRAIEAIHSVLNYIENEFMDSNMAPEVIDHLNNEMAMLTHLHYGVQELQKQELAIESGEYIPEELPPWLRGN